MSDIVVGGGQGAGSISIATDGVSGEAGPYDARLVLPLVVRMNPRPHAEMLALTNLVGSLHLVASGTADSDQNQFGPAVQADLAGFHCRSLDPPLTDGNRVELRFPLTPTHLAVFEAHRHNTAGTDFNAVLRLKGVVVWLYRTGNEFPGPARAPDPSTAINHPFPPGMGLFSFVVPFWNTRIDDLPVRIPQSTWVDRVLPGLGLDRLRLVELALPAFGGPLPQEVVPHFDAARRDYDAGRYRECIQQCRSIRHAVERHLGATEKQPVQEQVGQRLGWPADSPQRMFLAQTWKALVDLTNAALHRLDTVFQARDARACLLTTAVLLEYLERLVGP